jgi:ATP-dependent protease ClpP protease subunit
VPDSKREWFKFATAKAADKAAPAKATLHVYDVIGADVFFGGVDVNEAVALIDGLDENAELDVRINSPGGAAWDGLTLANAIMRHPGKTTSHVDGLAASAASLVALAADDVVISAYGQMMLHNARGGLYGTAEELKAASETLGKLNGSMAAFYADRSSSGDDAKVWARAMSKESWYNAEEALEAGLATAIDESGKREEVEAAASASIARASAMFRYPGRQAAPGPLARVENGPSGPDQEEAPVATSKAVLDALGLPEGASDEDVIAKIAEGGKPDDKPADTDKADKVDEGEISELAKAAAKHGLTVIDPGTLAEMQRNSSLGASAHAAMETQRITGAVDAAISLGKITAARKDHFVALMRADEVGTTQLLANIPAETAVPMTELGHSLEPQAHANAGNVAEDPKYKAWSVE